MADSENRELTVFSSARRLPAGRREAFLDEACAGDAALRQRVEQLLRASEEAREFLQRPAVVPPVTRAIEKPGTRIGHYKLLEQIGEGGCGVVYMAEQEEPVRRKVALKVIKLGMDTKQVIARFEAERQALALMDHPNIARVLDAGATETGRPYFVMELVRGIKITDFCDQNSLSTSERLDLFIHVCQAIQHAHQKGVIHRDIKPSNILVTMNDDAPLAKVIDFGIAKATHGKLTDQTLFTAFEQFIGTPAYMSPEQAQMSALDVDTRSDIYSLGVLLYELLTGRTPFDAGELLQAGLAEIRRTISEEEPERPSTRLSTLQGEELSAVARRRQAEPPKLVHLIRGDLDWIVMKALEKDRSRRYETANGLAADIQRHLKNEEVLARPPSGAYRFQKLIRRNKLVFSAAAAITAALAGGIALSVWALVKERQAHAESEQHRLQAESNALKAQAETAKSRQVSQFLEDMLKGVGPSAALGRDTKMLREILDKTAGRVGADLKGQPEVEAELRYTLGEVYWELGDLEDAEAMHRAALSIRTNVFGPTDPLVAQSMRRLAHVLWRQGHLDQAEAMALAGVAMQRGLSLKPNLDLARSLEDLSAIYNTKGNWTRVESALRESLAIKRVLLEHDNLELADTMDDFASWMLSQHRNPHEAEALLREATEIRRKLLGADNPLVVMASLKAKINEFDNRGKSSEEEAALKDLLALKRQVFGSMHPNVAQSLNLLASVLKNERKTEEAEPLRREALAIQQKLLGEESAEASQTMFNLAELLTDEGKFDEAESLHRRALRIRRSIFGSGSTLVGNSITDLGQLLEKEGKPKDAEQLYLIDSRGSSVSAAAAQYDLAMLYLDGAIGPARETEAARWLKKSAGQGNKPAEVALAVLYFNGTGVPQSEEQAVALFQKAAAQGYGLSMKTLAACYCSAGRAEEGLSVLANFCQDNASDVEASLTLAAWQGWFGRDADYEATRQRLVNEAASSEQATTCQRAAKAACLRPSPDTVLLTNALNLALRGAELRKGTPWLPWYQLALGMAQYRTSQYADAERTLLAAEQKPVKFELVPATAGFFRAMCLFRLDRLDEARQVFHQAEAQMPPFPAVENRPVLNGAMASHDVMICWLAYREARSLLN